MSSRKVRIPPMALPRSERKIGILGAGGIVANAHLPAYLSAGYTVSAIADLRAEVAEKTSAGRVPRVFADARALVECAEVDVIDVAIPEHGRADLWDLLLEAKKPVLVQKPLAYELRTSESLVQRFAAAGVPLAVNQNARWAPPFRGAKWILDQGWLGEVFDIRWTMRNSADFQSWARDTWYSKDERFQLLSWSIHHLDLFRYWLQDEPVEVFCRLPRRPGQHFRGEIMATAWMRFRSGCQVTMVDSNACTPGRPEIQEVDLDGTGGSIYAKVSDPVDLAVWFIDEIDPKKSAAPVHRPTLQGKWYPDGFAGSMGEFLFSLDEDRPCSISGADNLGTLRLIDACYRSAESGAVVKLD